MFPNAAQVAAEIEKEGKSKWLRDAFASAFGEVKEERKSATEELNEAPVPSPELIASEMEGAAPAVDSAAMDFAMQEVAAEIGANIKQTGANTGDIESLKRNEVVAPLAFSYEPPAEQPFVQGDTDGFPYGDTWSFGVLIASNKVTIYNIACQIGDATEKTLSNATVTIESDDQYVYFRCPIDSSAMSVGVTSTVADFDISPTYYSDFIVQCNFDGTTASLKRWGCAGQRQKHAGNFGQL